MSEINSFTTTIIHEVRNSLSLSCNEYCVVDLIDISEQKSGWCDLTRQEIADKMGISKQAIIKILSSLLKQQLVNKDEANKKLQSSEKWKKSLDSYEERNAQVIVKEKNDSIFNIPWRPTNQFIPFSPKASE